MRNDPERSILVTHEPIGVSGRYLRTLFDEGVNTGLTDGQLLERCSTHAGETAELAFTSLVERHGPMVLRACRGILRDDHEAMDAFQATFLVLIRKSRSLWVRDSLGPWLHRVACRAAARIHAEMRRRKAGERQAVELKARMTNGHNGDELAELLHEEIDRLPDRFRVPIVLCELEGYSCEQAARHIGCPVGTVGSRLVRGRERLRLSLVRRGVVPSVATVGLALCTEANGTSMPAALADAPLRAVTGKSSPLAASLANSLFRSMIMAKWSSVAAGAVAALGIGVGGVSMLRPSAIAQAPQTKPGAAQEPVDPFRFMNDTERLKDSLYAEIGNMRPLITDDQGVRFHSREAVLYKDGTAKLWRTDQKEAVAPPLRHEGAIRNITFFDQAKLLVTQSDESVKLWDGLSGELRKELPGQYISPMWLSFVFNGMRFISIDSARTVVTVWDASTLKPVAKLRLEKAPPTLEAGLSNDGKTAVTFTFGKDEAIELWDVATGRSFAVLRPPSRAVKEAFTDDGAQLYKARLLPSHSEHIGPFWDIVNSLGAPEQKVLDDSKAK
jgi:RNA polymerase sigma factor (sigma-70 family)